jgi:coenzyme F420-reducing hydrogenase beta subunit
MLYFTKEKYDCTGCGACKAVCPVDCITLIYDEEGFLYPISDARCIDCGKCERVCPMINKNFVFVKEDFQQYSIVGRHKSDHIWKKSASGGAFTAICELYHEDDGAIFGVRFNGTNVVHDYVRNIEDIGVFRKSKYVQSDMGNSYHELKKLLDNNKKVIFSGTPCQVAGIKNYLGKNYDNLLCIDLICHGVGSPGVFRKYIEYLEKRYGSKIKSFTFRHKKIKMGRMLQYVIVVEFENGKIIENENDIYNTAFIQALILRPSCEKCRFANIHRVGDLTIGDFKKKHELLPEAKGLDNFSTIIVNSKKGEEVASQLEENMVIYSVEISDIIKTNPPLRQASRLNENRELLFQDLLKDESVETILMRYITNPKLYMKIWMSLPDRIRGFIKRRIKL